MLDPLFLISSFLFLTSLALCLWKGSSRNKLSRLLLGLFLWVWCIFTLLFFAADSFTGAGYTDGVTYQLLYGFDGVNFINFFALIIGGILFGILSLIGIFWGVLRKAGTTNFVSCILFFLAGLAIALHPTAHYSSTLLFHASQEIGAEPIDPNSSFYEHYQEPHIKQIGEPKNLVVLYLESLERTFFDETLFPDLTPNLKKLEQENIHFTNLGQPSGIGFTVGAMVGSQCGIPPVAPSHPNYMGGMNSYLAHAKCLGDLLSDHNYYLSYYGGANSNYGGKGTFYKSHGFDEVKGLYELRSTMDGNIKQHGWGLYDDSLLDIMYERFVALSQKDRPFGLFSVTLDTHAPGYRSPACRKDELLYQNGKSAIYNAVKCADYLIPNFVQKIRNSAYSEDTVIVIVTDHLGMNNSALQTLKKGVRRPLFIINLPNPTPLENTNDGSLMDLASTVLPFIGFEGNFGLGRNLLSEDPLASQKRLELIRANLRNWRLELMSFWNFPKLTKKITFEIEEKNRIFVDGKPFKVPVLVEIGKDLRMEPTFSFDPFRKSSKFFGSSRGESRPFLIVDKCYNTNLMVLNTSKIDFAPKEHCIVSPYNHQSLKGITQMSKAEILEFSGFDTQEKAVIIVNSDFNPRILEITAAEVKSEVDVVAYLNKAVEHNFSYFTLPLSMNSEEEIICDISDCKTEELFAWITAPQNNDKNFVIRDIMVLRSLVKNAPEIIPFIIAQIEDPTQYQEIKEDLGYGKVIWDVDLFMTKLETSNISIEKGLSVLRLMEGSLAVAISPKNLNKKIQEILKDLKIPYYAHTKSPQQIQSLRKRFRTQRFYFDRIF